MECASTILQRESRESRGWEEGRGGDSPEDEEDSSSLLEAEGGEEARGLESEERIDC